MLILGDTLGVLGWIVAAYAAGVLTAPVIRWLLRRVK